MNKIKEIQVQVLNLGTLKTNLSENASVIVSLPFSWSPLTEVCVWGGGGGGGEVHIVACYDVHFIKYPCHYFCSSRVDLKMGPIVACRF